MNIQKYMHYIQRQQLINKYFEEAEKQKLRIVQQNFNDPFEIYYYPTPVDDAGLLDKLEENIKNKIVQSANIQKLKEVQDQLKKELYLVEEQLETVKIGNQQLDDLIKMYEAKMKVNDIRNDVSLTEKNYSRKEKTNYGCQTNQIKVKQTGTSYTQQFNEIKLKKIKNKLHLAPSYSLTIQSKLSEQIQAIPTTTISKLKQKPKLNIPGISPAQPLIKTIPTTFNSRPNQLYTEIQKQIKYLDHLKKQKKHRSQYKDQKNKVKFLMEMFWKTVDARQEDITLPIIRQD